MALLVACGGEADPESQPRDVSNNNSATTNQSTDEPAASKAAVTLAPSSCPDDGSNCVVAQGTIIYVEAVDPDGDGDAHFVTSSKQSVTLPGITIFDVNKDLRPDPLPGIGDLIGGAGPVYPGHAGQKQIQVTEFHVAK